MELQFEKFIYNTVRFHNEKYILVHIIDSHKVVIQEKRHDEDTAGDVKHIFSRVASRSVTLPEANAYLKIYLDMPR